MNAIENKTKNTKKEFSPKDAVFVFTSFTFVCLAIIFMLIVYDVLTMKNFLTFDMPGRLIVNIVIATFGLLLFGVILTLYIPSKYIDDTNKSYQNYSFLTIFSFMFLGALFEELLFRGIVQNMLSNYIENEWMAIIATTVLFLAFHIPYFKKPMMLINIAIPSFIFGWIYFNTNNILVPFIVHFLLNLGMTLLFKYNIIKLKH